MKMRTLNVNNKSWFLPFLVLEVSLAFRPISQHGWKAFAVNHPSSQSMGSLSRYFSASYGPEVQIIDHLNVNHERGRHDLVRAFYFDVLGCAVDPRKAENIELGRKTLWANAGIHQFHLSEGSTAQVLDGAITLAYADLEAVRRRLHSPPAVLKASRCFGWSEENDDTFKRISVTDPWGTCFILEENSAGLDLRGRQPGAISEPLAITDILIHVSHDANLSGIGRFYEYVLGFKIQRQDESKLILQSSPIQTLSFQRKDVPEKDSVNMHVELSQDEEGLPVNNGAHLSLYVDDLTSAYERTSSLGSGVYVNHRFKRRADTLEKALDQCMFRVLDVMDPLHPEEGVIFRFEHEVRSVITKKGTMYKSCPFNELPKSILSKQNSKH